MKCKMQDNLEFLQWLKKFWDRNFPGDVYDAVARRGAANEPAAANRSTNTPVRRAMHNNGGTILCVRKEWGPILRCTMNGIAIGYSF